MITSIPNRKNGEGNIGSLRDILWLPMKYITYLYKTTSAGYVQVDITSSIINTVEKWNMVEFIPGTGKFESEWAKNENGIYFKQKVSFKVAKHYDIRVQDFTDMQEQEFCVVAIDQNDVGRIIGEINYRGERKGMTFHDNATTGEELLQRNEYPCYFYTECAARALPAFWTSAPPVEPPHDPGPIIYIPPVG